MTHQDDWSSFLKAKLEDRNPKCGNCRYWKTMRSLATIGDCENAANLGRTTEHAIEAGRIAIYQTTDLSLCSAWEKKEQADLV